MLLGYARISTPDQKLDLQLDALQQVGCERIFQDVISSTRLDRPGLQAALSHLRPGDTFVIWKLDRLGRSVKGLITLTETLKARGIAFVSLQDKSIPRRRSENSSSIEVVTIYGILCLP